MSITLRAALGGTVLVSSCLGFAQTTLGTVTFNDLQFGDSLSASDSFTAASTNYLNVNDSDPGSNHYLTQPDFDTGIANIGLNSSDVAYTIGYNTPIVNLAGT